MISTSSRIIIQQLLEIPEYTRWQKFYLAPLLGLAKIYLAAGRLREEAYRLGFFPTAKLPCRVICVGNLTVGGTGKTPTVELVCRTLQQRGEKAGVISRGYGGRPSSATVPGATVPGATVPGRRDVIIVSDGEKILSSPQAAGDEPIMLARRLKGIPVLTGKSRYEAGQRAIKNFHLKTLVLDDGFQHLQLARDLNIVVMDGLKPFGNGYGLPAGKLRESPLALARADMILLTKISDHEQKSRVIKKIRRYNTKAPVVVGRHQPRDLISLQGDQILPLTALKGKSIVALCGIGDPAYFVATLKNLGAGVMTTMAFSDHHWYSPEDIRQIERKAAKTWAMVTTEKDAVRISGLLHCPAWVLRIDMAVVDGKELWEKKLNQEKNTGISSLIG